MQDIKMLKRMLKRKIKITDAVLVLFLITNGISYAAFTIVGLELIMMEEISLLSKRYI